MSTGNSPRDDAELEDFLNRKSALSGEYENLGIVAPSASLDARILAAAAAAARPATKAAPTAAAAPAAPAAAIARIPPARRPEPAVDDGDDDEDVDDALPARRPRWLVPAALAASVLAAVGIGFAVLDVAPSKSSLQSASEERRGLGSLFAKRARERSEAEKASAAAAAEAAAMEMEAPPLPPPPPFVEFDGPQVADIDAAIILIRRELIMARERDLQEEELSIAALADPSADPAADSAVETRAEALPETQVETQVETQADAATGAAARGAAPASVPVTASTSVIQSRNRRLAKVLELYDTGNPFLAEDALEIFLRDFADDPISQRILGAKP